ncbi:MAG: sporulation YhaL family protein [Bacillaceae bacterium]|nr:sporulation YhaL family protein [Bacillaceae bacterium]
MNRTKLIGTIIGICLGFLVLSSLGNIFMGHSTIVYILMLGIVISGYLSYSYAKYDRDQENLYIEKEGEIIMREIRERREQRL